MASQVEKPSRKPGGAWSGNILITKDSDDQWRRGYEPYQLQCLRHNNTRVRSGKERNMKHAIGSTLLLHRSYPPPPPYPSFFPPFILCMFQRPSKPGSSVILPRSHTKISSAIQPILKCRSKTMVQHQV